MPLMDLYDEIDIKAAHWSGFAQGAAIATVICLGIGTAIFYFSM